ncbi:MAG: type 1 glutamine amidotransferase [Bifidobacterium tsurumiense]|uniref:type 1 glutamine amidotransferase n=1 Tax=Bifidobacterium tsurumiense TaxID=356829 RepID=UPI002A82F26C|nr:type 1 glutamine amidotransferase [Bifidobacterium tsurumiense]MDY4677425.1 type 1 glutamine amidotransferase [Bifidobacterium tsurumiense]
MTSPHVLIVQHAPWEKPGRILDNLEDLELPIEVQNVAAVKKPEFPHFDELAGVVFMGGPMNATDYDKYPGLKAEAKLARAAIGVGKPVLGICLGHQIVANALGAKVTRAEEPEIGFSTIKRVDKHDYFAMWGKELNVLQWHSDEVSLPDGAQLLARSAATKNQAFRLGSALCLQFHLEVSAALLEEWLDESSMVKGLKKSQIAQIREDMSQYDAQIQPLAEQVFSGFAARCNTYMQSL